MRTQRDLRCHLCGCELEGGLDTFGHVGQEICAECESKRRQNASRHIRVHCPECNSPAIVERRSEDLELAEWECQNCGRIWPISVQLELHPVRHLAESIQKLCERSRWSESYKGKE